MLVLLDFDYAIRMRTFREAMRARGKQSRGESLSTSETAALADPEASGMVASYEADFGLEATHFQADFHHNFVAAEMVKLTVVEDLGLAITDAQIATGLEIWEKRGAPRRTTALPRKWEFFSTLMAELGLGAVSAGTLEVDWAAWRRLSKG